MLALHLALLTAAPSLCPKTPPTTEAAVATMLVPQVGHAQSINALSFNSDGRFLLSSGDENAARLWHVQTGALLRSFHHPQRVTSSSLSANGAWVALGGADGMATAWDAGSGALLGTVRGDGSVEAIHVSNDGRVAVAYANGASRVFAARTSAVAKTCPPTKESPIDEAFTRDGAALVIEGEKTRVTIDPMTCAIRRRVAVQSGDDLPSLSGAGARVVLSLNANQDLRVLDATSGREVERIREKAKITPYAAALDSSEKRYAVAYSNGSLELVTIGVAKRLPFELRQPAVDVMAISADGSFVASGDTSGLVVVSSARDGKIVSRLGDGDPNWLAAAAFSPDGHWIASGGKHAAITLWDLRSAARAPVSLEHAGWIRALRFSPDSQRLASVTGHFYEKTPARDVRLWDLRTATVIGSVAFPNGAGSLSFSNDGRLLVVGGWDKTLHLIDVASFKEVRAIGLDTDVDGVVFAPDGNTVIAYLRDSSVRAWSVTDGAERWRLRKDRKDHSVNGLSISQDGARLALTASDKIELWDLKTGTLLRSEGTGDSALDTTFSSDGKELVVATGIGELRVLDVATLGTRCRIRAHAGSVHAVARSSGGDQLVSASYDGTVRVWNATTEAGVTLFSQGDEWLIYGDDGIFEASRRGGALVAAVRGLSPSRIDQLAARNNRPDLLLRRLGSGQSDAVAYFEHRWQRRLKGLGLSAGNLDANIEHAPVAEIVSVQAIGGGRARVTFDLTDNGPGLLRYDVFVNDVPVLGASAKAVSGARQRVVETVDLSAGRNRIEVAATNQGGVESLRAFRLIDAPAAKGTLWFVGFGVSKYKDARLDLAFAHKDVLDFADVLRASSATAKTITYVDEQVTTATIRAAKAALKDAKVDDTVIVFVAGHGAHSRDADAEYYFLTHDADATALATTAARFDEIEDLIKDIAPRKKLLLLDTCESGERDEESASTLWARAGQRGLASRGLQVKAAQTAAAPAPRIFLLNRERYIFNDLSRRTGAVVFSSSRGSEASFERADLKNGVFTEEILTALTGDVADRDRDGVLTLAELRAYVERAVASSTGDLQHPTVDRDNADARFALPIAPAARAIVTR